MGLSWGCPFVLPVLLPGMGGSAQPGVTHFPPEQPDPGVSNFFSPPALRWRFGEGARGAACEWGAAQGTGSHHPHVLSFRVHQNGRSLCACPWGDQQQQLRQRGADRGHFQTDPSSGSSRLRASHPFAEGSGWCRRDTHKWGDIPLCGGAGCDAVGNGRMPVQGGISLCCSFSCARRCGLAGDMPQKTTSCRSCCRKTG